MTTISQVLYEAARRIKTGENMYGCCAIDDTSSKDWELAYKARDYYAQVAGANPEQSDNYYYYRPFYWDRTAHKDGDADQYLRWRHRYEMLTMAAQSAEREEQYVRAAVETALSQGAT